MRRAGLIVALLVAGAGVAAAGAAERPALDATKYPQDTPQKALSSLIKALETRDLYYWLAHLVIPEDSKRLTEKYGSLDKAVEVNADEKNAERLKTQCTWMKKLLSSGTMTEGEENGVKWARYQLGDRVLQLDKQADGRWCMRTRVNAAQTPNK
ncbi:MAG: hypothetical protein NTW87_37180 [Planctomycetota bacterium]|nr:hypothetical protein [Planctomycetota bacterium]